MIYNWSKYRRKQNNLLKAEYNYIVNEYLTKHYRYLHSKLVKSDDDEATFNDTYLKLTSKYNPDKDFIELFCFFFNLLNGEYMRDDKCYNYAESKVEVYSDNSLFNTVDNCEKPTKLIKPNLINSIKLYAILEEKQKLKNKATNRKQKRKIANIPE